jgi:L-threonylcarbamoyladenylate synthase
LFAKAVRQAAARLRRGELVVLPTETVYGLAANALDPEAVARIYDVKGRPRRNPIIVHVASLAMARRCVACWPSAAAHLAAAFWPGPLTLVLPRAPVIPAVVTAGGGTVGVRWPSHPLVQAVIRACGFPLAAPSANLAGQVSPTTAAHVVKTLGDRIPLIVDGGPCQVGIESTVLDLSVRPPRVLRPGMVHAASLGSVLGKRAGRGSGGSAVLKSPGLLKRHYAPRARLAILAWRNDAHLAAHLAALRVAASATWILAHTRVPSGPQWGGVRVMPRDPGAFARALYAELHGCDDAGARAIVVEAPPRTAAWQGIRDRLQRGSTVTR